MHKLGRTVLALGGSCWLAAAQAQEGDAEVGPDLDFLEYLGAWAGEDDEWLAIEEWEKDARDASSERAKEAPDPERDEDDEKSE